MVFRVALVSALSVACGSVYKPNSPIPAASSGVDSSGGDLGGDGYATGWGSSGSASGSPTSGSGGANTADSAAGPDAGSGDGWMSCVGATTCFAVDLSTSASTDPNAAFETNCNGFNMGASAPQPGHCSTDGSMAVCTGFQMPLGGPSDLVDAEFVYAPSACQGGADLEMMCSDVGGVFSGTNCSNPGSQPCGEPCDAANPSCAAGECSTSPDGKAACVPVDCTACYDHMQDCDYSSADCTYLGCI